METLNTNKLLANNITNEENKITINKIDELIVLYYYKVCGCPNIFFTIWFTILLPLLFIDYCCNPYKKVVTIDKNNNILIICDKAMIPCCNLNPKSYSLTTIKKIRIYVYSTPDPQIGFNKLYFINCEIYSINGEKEDLFSAIKYDKESFDSYVSFFKKYFDTEVEPIETAKDKDEYNISDGNNNFILNENEYPKESEIITTKPEINEGAAVPVVS